jgi:GT2 family glycosyltransferase
MKSISIVIITYNRPDDLLELLHDLTGLQQKELLSEVVIVNNASSADYSSVKSFVQKQAGIPFHYVEAPSNLGVAAGRNYATQFAKGEILVYVDDDIKIEDGYWLQRIVDAFSVREFDGRKLGVIAFKVLYSANRQMQQTAFPHKQFEEYKNKHSFRTYYYAGCGHAKLRSAWDETGPYPEDFFYGMEEYDFSYRLLDKGYCIRYDDSVMIVHKESPLGRQTRAEKLEYMWVNKSKVSWRYLPKKYFFSASIMWCLQFLRRTRFNLSHFISGWKLILMIPSREKRSPLKKQTLEYLKSVDARLWY